MGKGEVKWEELQRRGPPVRALCFGINAYTSEHWTDLVNCERDAEEIAGQVRRLPDGGNGGCRAKVVKGPQLSSKRSMEASVKEFLRDVDKECPPRMVFISYSGHSIQVGTDVMMVPSGASGCDEPDKLKQECFSHNDLFRILYEDMHCKTKVQDIYYFFIVDACRETIEEIATLDPIYRDPMSKTPRMLWAMCAGTNRGSLASDAGQSTHLHGRFTSHIISVDCGLFEPNVPMRRAMRLACDRVQRERVVGLPQQVPLMLLDNVDEHFCLHKIDGPTKHFDVCLCYRRDRSLDIKGANFIKDVLTSGTSRQIEVFRETIAGEPDEIQIAKAVCNCSIFILVITEETFADIERVQTTLAQTDEFKGLQILLQQMDMILEIYEHNSDVVQILPVYFGGEGPPSNEEIFLQKVEDTSKCWPALLQENPVFYKKPSVRVEALKQLRLHKGQLACKLHDRDLKQSLVTLTVPSLIKGRDIGLTMKAFSKFNPVHADGRKYEVGSRILGVVERALIQLETQSKRLGKRSASPQRDAGEGSSSGVKRHSSGLPGASGGSKRAYSRSGDGVDTKKSRLEHAGGGGSGGQGQGSGGGCVGSSDSTQQAFPYDVFISHAWDKDDEGRNNQERAKRLNAGLKSFGMRTWFDDDRRQGNNYKGIAQGIRGSAVVLVCVTRQYMEKVEEEAGNNCKREFEFAAERRTDLFMLPVVMEECMTDTSEWDGSLGLVLGRHLCHKLTSDVDDEFDKAVSEIAAAVRAKIDERLLPDLQQATSRIVQDAVSSREASPTPSDQSDMSTAPQSPSSPSEVMGFHVESTVSAFRDDMKKFMQDFLHQRRFCELLLVAFMRDKVAPSCDVKIARNLETWQEKCEDLDANLVICFNKIMRTLKPSILKEQLNYEFSDVNEKNHTSVFVIDWMVQHSPWALNETKIGDWIEEVVRDFDPNNADGAEDFLERAEKFLQKAVKGEKWGIKILGKVIETNSYVAFFRMEALAALLLREYCSQQKISHEHQQKQHDAQETAQKRQCSLPLAIGLIVSSSNWHMSFSKGKGPSSACVSEMAWHLQRIACLPAKTLENNEYSFSQLESVKYEPLYNLLQSKIPVSMPHGAKVRPINAERETRVREIYGDETARSVIQKYLEGLMAAWGSYIDSASGDERRIDGQAVSLLLLKSTSFFGICDSDDAAAQEDLICPISHKIMRDPVKCSDGHTYERTCIEKWAHEKGTSPKTREILKFDEQGEVKKVCWRTDEEILEKIKQFKEEKRKELEDSKQSAEGEEEKRILRSRLGYTWRDGDSKGRKEEGLIDSEEEEFQSAEKFLQNLLSKTGTGLACLTGPPASGKTVTMQKIVCTHAATRTRDIQMEEDGTSAVLPIPLLPLFMRAAELSKLLSETGKDAADLSEYLCDTGKENMRYLVELFLDKSARQELFPVDLKNCILELFDNDHVLVCIDGLDEAAPYQDLVEDIIDKHVAEKSSEGDVRMLISTREHSYVNSRKLRRLADFDVVKLQPLDKDQQLDMIKGRLIPGEQVETFLQQLAGIADKNPELATSPFLLSLMIEVYKNDGSIPSQRVKLYAKQVKAIVLRCIATRTKPVALEVATDYLEILAFVCQVKRSQRDFSLAACADDVKVLWKHTPDDLDLARECLFGTNMVGLLTRVGEDIYRFSHLTLQEYLAATCAVRLFGLDAQELLNQLQPLHSPWKRMVVQFAACLMDDEEVFEGFCQLVLASDDGTGSHCELVQDFLKERGASVISEKVERMVRGKLQEIRGSECLVAGLCHPSSELRHIVLSEMKKFGVPPDPFAETDGTAAALRQIAEDGASKWHTRAAALLSLVQMAQMDHCRKGNGRSDTLQWLLGMLKPDQDEDIRFALVAGLGTLLKGVERNESKDGIMLVAAEDEPLLLSVLKQSANRVVVEAVADLKAYSDGLMDWVLNESSLIAEGVWPMRHLLHVFCIKTATSGNHDRAEKLGQQLFGRVHAVSEETFEKEQDDVLKGLKMICPAMRDDILPLFLHLLKSGEVKQRSRVMQVAAELGMQFVSKSRESLDTLAQALLSDVVEGCTLAGLMEGGSLLATLMRDESDRKHKSLREPAKVFVYLMESLGPSAEQGIEAPKLVVDFLVEFEKIHLAAAAAAAAAKAAAAGKGNETKAIEKVKEMNPEKKGTEDKNYSADLSLERLAAAVEDFTPRDLSTRIRQPEQPLNLYCAARLWATSGLLQERTSEEIAACLSLSEAMAKEAEDAFSNLQGLKEPSVSGHGCKDDRWLQHVLEGMRNETLCLARFMFTIFLGYIRERQMKDTSGSGIEEIGIEEIEKQMKEWQPSGARGQLEQQLLLKEVRIGRRSQELPSWTGAVSAIKVAIPEFVSLVNTLSSCLHSEREAMDLLDKETYDRIFKARTSPVKGGGGGTRLATRATRGGGGPQRGQSEEKIEVERVLSDLHDFRDASGFWTSDWVLQVTVKQHDGKDDAEGEHIATSRITKGPNFRLYSVDPDLLIRVTVKNLSSTRAISLMPVHVKDNGEEEPEELVELKSGECYELPFPLQKEAGEEEDGWAIKDSEGKTVLKLRFTL